MLDAITTSQLAMLKDQTHLELVNQNISNMQTPAYKRQIGARESLNDYLDFSAAIKSVKPLFMQLEQGMSVQTNQNTDLSLSGRGFFTVQTDEGLFYTRRGNFKINQEGELITQEGAKVLGRNGIIQVNDNSFKINERGEIFIQNNQIDQLRIVQFSNSNDLNYLGHGIYQTEEIPLQDSRTTKVLQGFLEQSNVKSSEEMMELIKISRHFECEQRIMKTMNNLLSSAINQLGEGHV